MRHVNTQLHDAGAHVGLRNVGVVGLLSMRLEKVFGIWGREFSPDYKPSQNEMTRFVQYEKPDFVGRELDDQNVGFVTSGGFGHRIDQSLALAYITSQELSGDANYEVPLVGQR